MGLKGLYVGAGVYGWNVAGVILGCLEACMNDVRRER